MAKRHRMTPKRKAALRKAQLASARKRRRTGNRRLAVAGGVTVLGAAYLFHRYRGPVKPKSRRGKELDVVRVTALHTGRTGVPVSQIRWEGRRAIALARTDKMINRFDKAAAEARKRNPKRLQTAFNRTRRKIRKKPIPKRNRFTRAAARRRKKK